MNSAKIQLSPAELKLLTNAEIILTKNRLLAKIRLLLEAVQESMQAAAPTFLNSHAFTVPPKISRGENYLGLPYLVLDYPRNFGAAGIFCIRSFFWWGHFFSSTLHLSGTYKNKFEETIAAAQQTFSKHHISVNTDPWQHHFESDNYIPIAGFGHGHFKKCVQGQAHLKIAAKLDVEHWAKAEAFLLENWQLYLQITDQAPRR